MGLGEGRWLALSHVVRCQRQFLIPCPQQQMEGQQWEEGLNKMPLLRVTGFGEERGWGGRTLTQPLLWGWGQKELRRPVQLRRAALSTPALCRGTTHCWASAGSGLGIRNPSPREGCGSLLHASSGDFPHSTCVLSPPYQEHKHVVAQLRNLAIGALDICYQYFMLQTTLSNQHL